MKSKKKTTIFMICLIFVAIFINYSNCDLPTIIFKDVIKKYGLESNTVDIVGHAVALYTNDEFLE